MLKVEFKGKSYELNKAKVAYVLTILTQREVEENEIITLMQKFHLFDEGFLEGINDA